MPYCASAIQCLSAISARRAIVARILPYNPDMSHIEIVIPFALPPAELAGDLLRDLQLPALSMLLARARAVPTHTGQAADPTDGFARALPHERWLAHRFGMAAILQDGGSPPIAAALMHHLGLEPAAGHWFLVQPVHYHIARDHLVLTDPRQLALSADDSHTLFAVAKKSFTEAGLSLQYGTPDCWFVHAERHRDLSTATPDATCGRNVDIWMPQGASARLWRKLQNDVQMEWHAHPVNEARIGAGQPAVNSLWLWGGETWAGLPAARSNIALFGFSRWMAAFSQYTTHASFPSTLGENQPQTGLQQVLASPVPHRMLMLDTLIEPALAGDWAEWLGQLKEMESCWLAPLLASLSAGKIDTLSLVISHATRLQHWSVSRAGLRQFWRQPSLKRLLS